MSSFKGSDDYLRQKVGHILPLLIFVANISFQFEEYVSAALSTVKYRAFLEKGDNNGIMITGGSG